MCSNYHVCHVCVFSTAALPILGGSYRKAVDIKMLRPGDRSQIMWVSKRDFGVLKVGVITAARYISRSWKSTSHSQQSTRSHWTEISCDVQKFFISSSSRGARSSSRDKRRRPRGSDLVSSPALRYDSQSQLDSVGCFNVSGHFLQLLWIHAAAHRHAGSINW